MRKAEVVIKIIMIIVIITSLKKCRIGNKINFGLNKKLVSYIH